MGSRRGVHGPFDRSRRSVPASRTPVEDQPRAVARRPPRSPAAPTTGSWGSCGRGRSPVRPPCSPGRRRRRRRCGRPPALRIRAGLVRRYSASSGIGAWFGTPTGPQRRVMAPEPTERLEVAFDPFLGRRVCAVRGGRCGTGRAPSRSGRAPRAPPRRSRRSAGGRRAGSDRPAEHGGPAEQAAEGSREERVAGVDRQPERRRTRRRWQPPAAAPSAGTSARARSHHSDSTAPTTAPARAAACSTSPIRRGTYCGHVRDPGLAVERRGGVAGVGQRPEAGCRSAAGRCRARRSAPPLPAASPSPARRARVPARPSDSRARSQAGTSPTRYSQ